MSVAAATSVWRIVFPDAADSEVLALYVDEDISGAVVEGRQRLRVAAGRRVSLGSYFNAFPAGYWRAETDIAEVILHVRAQGHGVVALWVSDGEGRAQEVATWSVTDDTHVTFSLSLARFDDGGAAWIDLAAGAEEDVVLIEAGWEVECALTAKVGVAMATFNRPDDCLAQLCTLGQDPHLPLVVERVVVVDQGTESVTDREEFSAAAAGLGDRLEVIRQPNLGGSGGFSRAMLQILTTTSTRFVLLLDDDARCDPEAIIRAVRFADAARRPIIVGGGMLHLDDRTRLYVQGEQWDHRIGWVRLARPGAYDHDFARVGFRETPFFHAPQRSDYAGWWMCLIPRSLLESKGLAMPLFLKGDDVEFGLRASAAGVRTVSVPGIALWHLGWKGKSPTRTWEAYFLHRNRLITELLHSPHRRAWGLIVHSFLGDVKPLLALQYSTLRLRAQAIADVLVGPASLPDWLPTRAAFIRRLWSSFDDATRVEVPSLSRRAGARPRGAFTVTRGLLRTTVRQLFIPERPTPAPVIRVADSDLGWWTFADVDCALVDLPDGSGSVIHRRSRSATRRALLRSLRLHLRLWRRWPALSRQFRAAASQLSSPTSWAEIVDR